MEGSPANKGVSPRAIQELLNQVEGLKETSTYTVTLSMLEIYNETILDLLPLGGVSKDREKLEIRQAGDGGNQVVGLTETIVSRCYIKFSCFVAVMYPTRLLQPQPFIIKLFPLKYVIYACCTQLFFSR